MKEYEKLRKRIDDNFYITIFIIGMINAIVLGTLKASIANACGQ